MRRSAKTPHEHGKRSSAQLSPKTWPDFDKFFADNGGVWGGCWCMFFHNSGGFDSHAYAANRDAKKELVEGGHAHGTMVYCAGVPVGWCQFGPKEELPRIDGKRGYKPSSDNPWRITCLFIASGHRKSGFAGYAVKESVRAMKKLGAGVIEAYPVEGKLSPTFLWSGTPTMFEEAGFSRVSPLGKRSWVYALKPARR